MLEVEAKGSTSSKPHTKRSGLFMGDSEVRIHVAEAVCGPR